MTTDQLALERTLIDESVGERAAAWDLAGLIPETVLRDLGARGILCPQVRSNYGGLGLDSLHSGELTAHMGRQCSSLRSVMTSQGMAAWTIQRLADTEQRREYLPMLTGGQLAAVGFSEIEAGSDLSKIRTRAHRDGDSIILTGAKVWMTAALYADLLIVFCRYGDDAAVVVVPSDTPGVRVLKVPDPMGCRAAGHANVEFDAVQLPIGSLLGGTGQSLSLLVTTALSYGRISVAWGCVGILRACLTEACAHARSREQFGKPLAEHQLIGRHLAELATAEQVSTCVCKHASRCWDSNSADMFMATVLAKHVSAGHAVAGAARAVQVLGSAGARDGHIVARAYRDAKLMEIIEGSTEICQLALAQHALSAER